jgi:hypothetical protein
MLHLPVSPIPRISSSFRYNYRTTWYIKPAREWHMPHMRLRTRDVVEIALDVVSSVRLLRGLWFVSKGERSWLSLLIQTLIFRIFICTDSRLRFYAGFFRQLFSGVISIRVVDCLPSHLKP